MTLSDLEREHPDVHTQLLEVADKLERTFKDAQVVLLTVGADLVAVSVAGAIMQEVEFTVENLQLHLLETRRAPRSDRAAVRIAADMVREGVLTEREALLRINPEHLKSFAYPMLEDHYCEHGKSICSTLRSCYR
jgi:pyruvate,orthophosphate dikinase